jgi:Tfp pilus assembly protein PilV
MKKQFQNGFAHLSLLLLVLVVAVVGLIGYKVAKNNSTDNSQSSVSKSSTPQVETIKTAADLDQAKTTLNNTNLDGDLNPDSLNNDVNNLL